MMRALFFSGLMIFSAAASADILFLDNNLSTKELDAARRAAAAKHEQIFIYPERSIEFEKQIEPFWVQAESLQSQLVTCLSTTPSQCDDLNKSFEAAMAGVRKMAASLQRLDGTELESIFANLEKKGVQLSTIVISGHSGGSQFAGLFGSVSIDDLTAAWTKHRSVADSVKMLLLWGCYSGTFDNLNNHWKKQFPNVKGFAGYGTRSPLGIRDTSGKYLFSFLMNEENLLAAKDLSSAHAVFRSIDMTAELDGTAEIGDYYMSYDEADSISDMVSRCQQFPEPLLDQYRCYNQGDPGCENPPPHHDGPLRDLYTFLQVNRHCTDLLKEKYPDIPTPDYLIRLIYLNNVKANFVQHHRSEFAKFTQVVQQAGVKTPLDPAAMASQTRAENIARFKAMEAESNRRGLRDGTVTSDPQLDQLIRVILGAQFLGSAFIAPNTSQLNVSCVPFSWVDIGSTDLDRCLFEMAIMDTFPQFLSDQLEGLKLLKRFTTIADDTDPLLLLQNLPAAADQVKKFYSDGMNAQVQMLAHAIDRSPHEDNLLLLYQYKIQGVFSLDDQQVCAMMIQDAEALLAWLSVERAKPGVTEPEMGVINYEIKFLQSAEQQLRQLLPAADVRTAMSRLDAKVSVE